MREQHDRRTGGSRFISIRVMGAILQSRQAILTALYRDTALLRPHYIEIPPYSDHLISGYRLAQTALYREIALLRPPYIEIPSYSDLYRGTALLRPPYIGIPPYLDRLTRGDPNVVLGENTGACDEVRGTL